MKAAKSKMGFSLIELMIVVGIGSVVILGIMATMDYQNRVTKTGDINRQVDDIKRQIQVWISTQSMCDLTFNGMKQGEQLQGIRSKFEGTSDDYVLLVGDRFPATNWTIKKMELLSSAQAQATFNYSGKVNAEGFATAVMHVQLAQLAGATGNVELSTTTQDRGSFAMLEKHIYFPIAAIFGDIVQVTGLTCDSLDTTKNKAGGGRCCADCDSPTAGQTFTQDVQAQTGIAIDGSTNPLYFDSSYNKYPDAGCIDVVDSSGFTLKSGTCYVYNFNMGILKCVSANVDPMSQ